MFKIFLISLLGGLVGGMLSLFVFFNILALAV